MSLNGTEFNRLCIAITQLENVSINDSMFIDIRKVLTLLATYAEPAVKMDFSKFPYVKWGKVDP